MIVIRKDATVQFLKNLKKSSKTQRAKRKKKTILSTIESRIISDLTILQSSAQCLRTTLTNDHERRIILKAVRMKNLEVTRRVARMKMSRSNILKSTKNTFSRKI